MSTTEESAPTAAEVLETWPRLRLAHLPTPLRALPRLAVRLGVAHAYAKMDAETGFALGGNKVRKLEYELAPGRLDGITHLVTAGGPQSNHCRVTAAAAARLGLGCTLVLNGPEPDPPTGNALLHRLFGAEIVTVSDRAERAPTMDEVARRVGGAGGRARVVPIGASTGLGSLGYARAALELLDQLDALPDGCTRTSLYVASSSGGTLAGLVLGLALAGRRDVHVVGVSADVPARELHEGALEIAAEGAKLLTDATPGAEPDLPSSGRSAPAEPLAVRLRAVPATVVDDQVGEGYGIPTEASRAAARAFARLEGIVLDPTYSSKAAAALLDRTASSEVPGTTRVVFLHTGGAPGLLT